MDFRFLFFEVLEDKTGEFIREKNVRVVMSPQQAVAFSRVLNETVARWREEHDSGAVENPEKEQ